MKCPNCGAEEPDYAVYCGKCAESMKESGQSTGSPEKSEKNESLTQMAPLIVMTDKNDESSETSPYLTAELQDSVSWWADPGSDGQAGVSLEGTIYNSGTENMVAIVHIRIFDGKSWRSYTENAGIVPAGGEVGFYWDQGLGQIDENAVMIEYVISKGKENEVSQSEPRPVEDQRDGKKTGSWEWHWRKGTG